MTSLWVPAALLLISSLVGAAPSSSYECGGCVLLITELENEIQKVDPKKMIETGSYRVNGKGEQQGLQQIAFARSQTHISDILEGACEKSKQYKLSVNPLTGKAVFVHKDSTYLKGDENASMQSKLHGACNDLVDSHEDEVIAFLGTERAEPVREFCQTKLGVCSAVDMSALPPDEPEDEPEQESEFDDEL